MAESNFSSLGIRDSIVKTLTALGYETPTPIQDRTIPLLLSGKDVIGQAQTGTGKTAAFALPILETIDASKRETQALVMTPTRELAVQVAEAIHSYAKDMNIGVLPVYGGAPIGPQLSRLERGAQVVVGTPGRLIDTLDRKSLKLGAVRIIVLDEADEMLKMGFKDDVDRILGELPQTRQIALFSATMPPEVLRIAKRHMPDAVRIEIEHKASTTPMIEQRFINTSEPQKLELLTKMLELEENDAVLIFRRTKTGAAETAERLVGRGFAAEAMHGDMNQRERESVIRRLKAGKIEIVVATDVAARGLDVEQITHVINYDIPWDVEAYVHRIGRTGRAGRSGMATLFITPRERKMMREIERFTKMPIKPMRMPTVADVAARRVNALKETLKKTMAAGDLDLYLNMIGQIVEEGHDPSEVAAAAAKLASAAKPLRPDVIPTLSVSEGEGPGLWEERSPSHPTARVPRYARDDKGASRPATPVPPRRSAPPRDDNRKKVRLSMSVGKRDGIRPADVVGSIANEADVPGRDIGPIEIQDAITYVTVPESYVDKIMEKVGRTRFRGRAVNLRIAAPQLDHKGKPPKR